MSLSQYHHHLKYLPLLVPPLLVASYVLRSLPISNRLPKPADPGLASLPLNSRARVVYSEDWIEGGAYAELPKGRVRYWVVGPDSGKKIALIHGLNIPALVYGRLVPILVEAGYRVLLYDLYGRGYSDAPLNTTFDTELYVTQLALLLQHLRWERTRLVGFSMGGAIAAAFVATFPALVEPDVVVIASAGAGESPMLATTFRNMPFVQWLTMRRVLARTLKVRPSGQTPLQELVRLQAARLRGYARAVISSLHDGPITRMRWAFTSERWEFRRVLLVHGLEDIVVPPSASSRLRSLLESIKFPALENGESVEWLGPQVQLLHIDNAGHDLTWTHADEVGRAMVQFLAGEAMDV
ncbi:Alpha/Beta hydrolase protein [Mycena crocata]|nr:Alpha/Beta hydrolase protein [Mycena crocata]